MTKLSNEANTAIAIRQETSAVMLTNAQLQMIANTSFVPASFRGKVPEVLACVATGRSLGLPDMTSLRGIHVIEGKATLSAELMVAIVRSHGHSITGTVGENTATVQGKRADNGDTMEATFTKEMAVAAGLAGKNNWKKHPDDMMWARAVSKLCRRLFADCFAGATYVPEEVEETADETMDEPSSAPPPLEVTETEIAEGLASMAAVPQTWVELIYKAEAHGFSVDDAKWKRAELFPKAKSPDDLTPADVAAVWDALVNRQETLA